MAHVDLEQLYEGSRSEAVKKAWKTRKGGAGSSSLHDKFIKKDDPDIHSISKKAVRASMKADGSFFPQDHKDAMEAHMRAKSEHQYLATKKISRDESKLKPSQYTPDEHWDLARQHEEQASEHRKKYLKFRKIG